MSYLMKANACRPENRPSRDTFTTDVGPPPVHVCPQPANEQAILSDDTNPPMRVNCLLIDTISVL